MAKIKLVQRVKYASDIHEKLIELGWDLDTAALFCDDLPDAKVEPVRHGRWCRTGRIFDGFIEVQCSECEETHLFDAIRLETAARYCAYCGVKWDGGADNGE